MRRFVCRAARRGRRVGLALAVSLLAGLTGVTAVPSAKAALSTSGYYLVGTDGGIFAFGAAKFFGSTGSIKLNQPVVGMAATPDGRGYWMVASDGGIFAFGSAGFYGSMGGKPLNQPIVGIASTRTGKGYWMVASDGGIFAFGDAGFYGSTGSIKLTKPIVDIVPSPTGKGYWMAASDGGIFAFGDAGFFGSTGATKLAKRIQQMAATPSGKGYWMVAGDGGIFAFGDAGFYGSAVDGSAEKRVVDIAATATGKGYYITASNGAIYTYGDAKSYGGAEALKLAHGIIGMVPINNGEPPVATNDAATIDEDGAATIDVLGNDRDPDGGILSIASVAPPLHGTADVVDGGISYHPSSNYNGTDTFSYTVIDSNGLTTVGLVSITIQPVDDLPRVIDDAKTVQIGQSVTIDVLANDSGLGDGLLDLAILPPYPTRGTYAKSADGRAIVYTATRKGTDTIRYRVVDNDGDNAEGAVKITVQGASPKAVDIGPINCSSGACTVDVIASGASLGANGQLTIVGESNGTKTIDNVGTFLRQGNTYISFTAAKGSVGQVSVNYKIADDVDSSTATLTFNYQNSPPTAIGGGDPDPLAVNAQASYQLSGSDPDGNEPLTFSLDGDYPGANVSIEPNGMLHFSATTPGDWTIRFHVTDAAGDRSDATFTIKTV